MKTAAIQRPSAIGKIVNISNRALNVLRSWSAQEMPNPLNSSAKSVAKDRLSKNPLSGSKSTSDKSMASAPTHHRRRRRSSRRRRRRASGREPAMEHDMGGGLVSRSSCRDILVVSPARSPARCDHRRSAFESPSLTCPEDLTSCKVDFQRDAERKCLRSGCDSFVDACQVPSDQ